MLPDAFVGARQPPLRIGYLAWCPNLNFRKEPWRRRKPLPDFLFYGDHDNIADQNCTKILMKRQC